MKSCVPISCEYLQNVAGNQSRAADVLDIDRVALRHKLKRFGWTRTPAESRN